MKDNPIRIGLFGASGKLGRSIAAAISNDQAFSLAAALVHSGSSHAGEIIEKTTMTVEAKTPVDLWIDASIALGLKSRLEMILKSKRPLVLGATGLSDPDRNLIEEAAREIPLFYTPNFSIGIALMKKLASESARLFPSHAHVDLIEAHHTRKKDAPSGTALELAGAVQKARPDAPPVAIHSIRSGEIVGEHTLLFNTAEEKISITHAAHSRGVFARGALAAARFLIGKPPHLYGMEDLIK